jgi:hypothetical protein
MNLGADPNILAFGKTPSFAGCRWNAGLGRLDSVRISTPGAARPELATVGCSEDFEEGNSHRTPAKYAGWNLPVLHSEPSARAAAVEIQWVSLSLRK